MTSSDRDIETLLDRRVDAVRAKDIDRLMSTYAPDIVYYDVVPTLQFVGTDEVRRNFVRWFDEYDGPIGLETHDLRIVSGAHVAFAHMLHRDIGQRRGGVDGEVWVKSTVCLRRAGTQWAITHEHISLPGDWLAQFDEA